MTLHKDLIEFWSKSENRFIDHASGYPVVYLDRDNCHLCAVCATEAQSNEFDWDRPVGVFTHYEGPPVPCDECSTEIESAYGDPPAY
jgi:ferredoxin